jgi:arsenical pump membrane protein
MTDVHLSLARAHPPAVWLVSLASIALVLIRPKGWSEAWWASAGAAALVTFGLISPASAASAVAKGLDVYLFLTGMMIMSELARREGVFDWAARHAVRASNGSRTRLFVLIYCVGTAITVLLSNDATAVVLTPAVLAVVREAEAEPLPYLMCCAFIANAASFVLPISNPANLVVYGSNLPPLGRWLLTFTLPSVVAIVVTFVVLHWQARNLLKGTIKNNVVTPRLSPAGKLTVAGIALLVGVLTLSSALSVDLGAPAFVVGIAIAAVVFFRDRSVPKDLVKEISWSVLPLVGGLFVIVEAMDEAGALTVFLRALHTFKTWSPLQAALGAGFGIAAISNLMNNLPSGLISAAAVKTAGATGLLRNAILIGVDLGPNLSVTGSLATILWLIAIRREGQDVGFWKFLRWGLLSMPIALFLSLLTLAAVS